MKKNFLIYVFLICISGLLTQSCEKTEEEPEPEPVFYLAPEDSISNEDYNVYSAVIEEFIASETVVIEQTTETAVFPKHYSYGFSYYEYYEYLLEENPDFDTTLIKTYNDLNETSINLGEHFVSDTKEIVVISSDELEYIFESGTFYNNECENYEECFDPRWKEFFRRYESSDCLVRFSRIAFNEDKSHAIIQIKRYRDVHNGISMHLCYLKKENYKWSIVQFIDSWTIVASI